MMQGTLRLHLLYLRILDGIKLITKRLSHLSLGKVKAALLSTSLASTKIQRSQAFESFAQILHRIDAPLIILEEDVVE